MAARPRAALLAMALAVASSAGPGAARADDAPDAGALFLREHGDRRIASIRVEGLRRTAPAVVWQWIPCAEGGPLSGCDLSQAAGRIRRLGIFTAVDVSVEALPEGAAVVFRIEEKWTLYPVPMLWLSEGTELGGLVLVEANLLGYNKGLALGGVASNRGWYAVLAYNDPNIAFSSLWGSLHGFLGTSQVENDTPSGAVAQAFEMTRFDVEWALGFTFWDRLSPAWNGAVRRARVGAVSVPGLEPAVDATVLAQSLQLIYSDRRYHDLYDDGLRVSLEAQHNFSLLAGSPSFDALIFDAKLAGAAPLSGFFEAGVHACLGDLPAVFEERLGGLDGSRTLPGSGLTPADRYASATVSWQVPLLTLGLGTATGLVFGEVGRYVRNSEPAVTYGGPGVGLRFFLRRVSVPAVGVDVGYEAGSGRFALSLVAGYKPPR
jgi:hypothetical protein